MDFAKKQLEKYGWSEGKGLGKNENGISTALKPNLKFDKGGVGHEAGKEFSNNWWDRVFESAAKNINVQSDENGVKFTRKSEDAVEITTKNYSLKELKNNKNLQYGSFIKTEQINEQGVKRYEGSAPPDTFGTGTRLTDEELFAACEGRTAHKGARHGLTLSGKLARIEKQEKMLMKKLKKVSLSDDHQNSQDTSNLKKKIKKLKQHKDGSSSSNSKSLQNLDPDSFLCGLDVNGNGTLATALASASGTSGGGGWLGGSGSVATAAKKKKKKRKSVSFNPEPTIVKFYTPDAEHDTSLDSSTISSRDEQGSEYSESDWNGNDEGIDLTSMCPELSSADDSSRHHYNHRNFTEPRPTTSSSSFAMLDDAPTTTTKSSISSNVSDLSNAERKQLKKKRKLRKKEMNGATSQFLKVVLGEKYKPGGQIKAEKSEKKKRKSREDIKLDCLTVAFPSKKRKILPPEPAATTTTTTTTTTTAEEQQEETEEEEEDRRRLKREIRKKKSATRKMKKLSERMMKSMVIENEPDEDDNSTETLESQ